MISRGNLHAMTTYTIHAVLPHVGVAAVDENGTVGFIGYDLEFRKKFPSFIDAAVVKYHYQRIHPTEVDANKLSHFMASVFRD